MKTNVEQIMEEVNKIYSNNDEGLLGFVVREVDDCSYDETGSDIIRVFNKYPEHAEMLDEMLIAVCGCSLIGCLPDEMKNKRDYYESL